MIEREIDITTRDGEMNTVVLHPENGGPFPPVVMYMPASGIREELIGLSRRLAEGGYFVMLPNLYYRLARVVDVDANRLHDPAYAPVRDYMVALSRDLTNARSDIDTGALLDFAAKESAARDGRAGVLGYCMGGRLAFSAIGAYPDRIGAMVSMYGAGLMTDQSDSPHLRADRIDRELYFGFAENDEYVASKDARRLEANLKSVGASFEIEVYLGTEHGFCFPKRYCFSPDGYERHWRRVFNVFGRNLV